VNPEDYFQKEPHHFKEGARNIENTFWKIYKETRTSGEDAHPFTGSYPFSRVPDLGI